jgi:hypothetical protein
MATDAPWVSNARAVASPIPREPPVMNATFPVSGLIATRILHGIMSTVCIIGAGDIGGAAAHALARAERVAHVLLVDGDGKVAAGKALDIQQSGAIDRFHVRLDGTDEVSRVAGCAACLVADRFGLAGRGRPCDADPAGVVRGQRTDRVCGRFAR